MGRSGFLAFAVALLIFFLLAGLAGCGSSNPIHTTNFPVPASITISPAPNLSMEIGTNQAFSASALNSAKASIAEPVTYQSSNTAVVTVAANGIACAGSWDSLSNPQICTPGPVGVAQVTATAQGVSSPPTTVYVHQHVDKVTVQLFLLPNQPPPTNSCYSVSQTANYQATAFSNGVDITSTVGVFTWQALATNVVALNSSDPALLPGQVQVTAKVPGLTSLFATIGNINSVPIYFTACPVESIQLAVTSSSSTSRTITPTVTDSVGTTINGVPLTWSSSEPGSISVSSAGAATGSSAGGGASIIASCTPPTCNTGFDTGLSHSLPIYPENVVSLFIPHTGTTENATVYVSTTGCGTTDGCFSTVVPITAPANTAGASVTLPATPNSLVFNRQGTKAYLGTNSGLLGSVGLTVIDSATNSASEIKSVPGKVLAVSPDGSKVIVSDTADTPNEVFVFDTATNSALAFQITGAAAADFSPDSLKAYIVAGKTLYAYSKIDALQTIALAGPANDVSFLSEGAFAYVAGGAPSSVTVLRTCDNGTADTVAVPVVPTFIQTLPGAAKLLPPTSDTPNTFHLLAVAPPDIDIIGVNTTPSGCAPALTDEPAASFNLGQGNFVAKQLIISQDGSTAYVIASNLSSILAFNIPGQTSSAVPLVGNPMPLSATLTPDGTLLYVGTSDGTVHVVSTVAGGDIQQVAFPQGLCQNSVGQPFSTPCNPDLVAVKP
ncbi:MAG TPA: hypothetical protein VNZ03_14380 [Terriglobales bacterium]|nr:hypothetical protein [Terriglobales bacterium]